MWFLSHTLPRPLRITSLALDLWACSKRYIKKAETGSIQIVVSKENTGHLTLSCDVFGLILKELFWNWILSWDLCLVCEKSGKETGYYKLIGGCLLPQHSVGLRIFISFISTRHLGIKIFHWKGRWQKAWRANVLQAPSADGAFLPPSLAFFMLKWLIITVHRQCKVNSLSLSCYLVKVPLSSSEGVEDVNFFTGHLQPATFCLNCTETVPALCPKMT